MLEITSRTQEPATGETITLPFQDRQRSRLKVALSSGEEALMMMRRGSVLRGGDRVAISDGRIATIVSAAETVSTVRARDARALARAAYHLGNRHMPLEVGEGFLRYLHDHVLDDMVRSLGLMVLVEEAPFEPEAGAYHAHSHVTLSSHDH